MQENKENTENLPEELPHQQDIAQDSSAAAAADAQEPAAEGEPNLPGIEAEIDAFNKAKNGNFTLKAWLCALTVVFSAAMISGLYIIFSGANVPERTEPLTVEAREPGRASTFLGRMSSRGEEGAAVVRLRGIVQEGSETGFSSRQSASATARRIRTLADRKEIKALVLDINSPGGTVAAVQDIYDAVLYFKSKGKPVVALFRDVAASGGFYIAMAADKIIAQPGTITGSIGVIMQTSNFEGLFDKIGVKFIPIKSGKHKDMGSYSRPMTEEEAALLQEMISDTYQQFFNAVRAGRPNVTESSLQIYADGRIFTGSRAKAIGLIDDLGGEDKAREYLADLTKIKDIKLLTPRVNDFFDMLSMSASGVDGRLALSKVEEISTPRVSYLWTY